MGERLLLFDLDGTLLRTDKTVSAYTGEVLRRCRADGMLLGLCTARGAHSAARYEEALSPEVMITSGGALAKLRGEAMLQAAFTQAELQGLLEAVRAEGDVMLTIDAPEGHYWNRARAAMDDRAEWCEPTILEDGAFDGVALKLCVHLPSPEAAARIASAAPGCAWGRFAGEDWYYFARPEATKENAIRQVCAAAGVDPADAVAFGDDRGDIGMLTFCGTGVAMGNALPEVKAAADAVTLDNDHDGAAVYLAHTLLGE